MAPGNPIPPHRALLAMRCSECLPWRCVPLPVGSDPGGSRVSVGAVTRFSCWHWHKSLCWGVPGCWKDVSAAALRPERVAGGFSGDVKDLHMTEEEMQFLTFVQKSWQFSSLWA